MKAGEVGNPKKYILDNEAYAEFKKAIREKCQLELVLTDMHMILIAEQAMQT